MFEDHTQERIEELIDEYKEEAIKGRGTPQIINNKSFYQKIKTDLLAKVCSMEGNWVEHPRYGTGEIEKNYYTYERNEWRCLYQPHNMEDSVDVPLKPPLASKMNGVKKVIEVNIEIGSSVS